MAANLAAWCEGILGLLSKSPVINLTTSSVILRTLSIGAVATANTHACTAV